MNVLRMTIAVTLLSGFQAFAAGAGSISEVQDHMLTQVEHEVVSAAEAMPSDKYGFAPTQGVFDGERTFGQQVSHIAAALDQYSSRILGEKSPDPGANENGPASLLGKEAILKYLKDAFAHSHKAMQSLTAENYTTEISMPHGKATRAALAIQSISHSMDHYGQIAIYLRMNGIVPPASRKS
jgi:uncharacterized damage-inducible protein DinB